MIHVLETTWWFGYTGLEGGLTCRLWVMLRFPPAAQRRAKSMSVLIERRSWNGCRGTRGTVDYTPASSPNLSSAWCRELVRTPFRPADIIDEDATWERVEGNLAVHWSVIHLFLWPGRFCTLRESATEEAPSSAAVLRLHMLIVLVNQASSLCQWKPGSVAVPVGGSFISKLIMWWAVSFQQSAPRLLLLP